MKPAQVKYEGFGNEDVDEFFGALIGNHEQFYREGATFLDCGAGSGLFALLVAVRLKAAMVYAYEGHHVNFGRLINNRKSNSALNIMPDDHHIHGETGRRILHSYKGVINSHGKGFPFLAETRRIDDLMLPEINYLNISVPGAALDIIGAGMCRIKRDKPELIVETVTWKESRRVKVTLEGIGMEHVSTEKFSRLGIPDGNILFFSFL